MDDKELLELAARAAGYRLTIDDEIGFAVIDEYGFPIPWNPLTDDGDSLRLAVSLNIQVSFYRNHLSTTYYPDGSHYKKDCCVVGENEDYGDDKLASCRRAIVRAAAEIGRAMG